MKFKVQIVGGKIIFPKGLNDFIKLQKDNNYTLEIKKYVKARSEAQNNSLHLFFSQLSDEFNEKGIEMPRVIRLPLFFTPYAVKDYIWRPAQISMFGKKSTTQITTMEINKIYDVINKVVSERTNGMVIVPPFPSYENQI